jgi:sec-independent protein translocase protein TatB
MFNVGGAEVMVILLVALLVLGPTKLPAAAKQVGKVMSDFKNMSHGFQREMRDAMKDPVEAATRDRSAPTDSDEEHSGSGTGDADVSTAERAGMYQAEPAQTPEIEATPAVDSPDPDDGA